MVAADISEFETLKDVVAAGRARDGTVLDVVGRPAPYSYHDFCTSIWKAGNLLGHYGVHAVGELAVAVGPKTEPEAEQDGEGMLDAAEPLLALFGGAIIGGVVDVTPAEPVDAPALVAPAYRSLDVSPSCSRLAYGGPPSDPAISHFEREVWSENPIEPPESVGPEDDALRFGGVTWTHGELLSFAEEVVEDEGIDSETHVVLRVGITEPGGFVAGVLAPLAAGGTIVVPDDPAEGDSLDSPDGKTVVVSDEEQGGDGLDSDRLTRSMLDTRRA